MLFWILVAVLVAGVSYAVTRPLMQPAEAPANAADADIAVYKDQLDEVAADAARGVLPTEDAEAARSEIARRLLRSTEVNAKPASGDASRRRRFVKPLYIFTSIALPVASLALYLNYGAPGLPGQPLSARIAEATNTMQPNDMIAKVEARLRDHPEDGRGWDVIAPVYYAMGRYEDAANAFRNALRIVGESPQRLQGFANARIHAENGIIPDDARKALNRILVIAPDSKEPRIWLALAKEQDGHIEEAAADYRKLIAEAPANAPWRKVLEDRVAALTAAADKGRAQGPRNEPNAGPADAAAPTTGTPPPADVEAVNAKTPEERKAFIGRMVDGLAARLKADATDASGWLKLIRAYQVLGRHDDATKALSDARKGLKDDKVGLGRVDELARQLGLGS
jgi:cytochrome c-type biogenesis protein CcmH